MSGQTLNSLKPFPFPFSQRRSKCETVTLWVCFLSSLFLGTKIGVS